MMQGGKSKSLLCCLPGITGPRLDYNLTGTLVRLGSIPAEPTGSKGQELFPACGVQARYAAANRWVFN